MVRSSMPQPVVTQSRCSAAETQDARSAAGLRGGCSRCGVKNGYSATVSGFPLGDGSQVPATTWQHPTRGPAPGPNLSLRWCFPRLGPCGPRRTTWFGMRSGMCNCSVDRRAYFRGRGGGSAGSEQEFRRVCGFSIDVGTRVLSVGGADRMARPGSTTSPGSTRALCRDAPKRVLLLSASRRVAAHEVATYL